mmetsp:Transcript_155018/g.281995  ORF Transcript_155018/g.281995 Transcript_155018/m.281995 type:complete len:634 (-) Transcript_155018:61-1962(-)
MCNLLSLVLAFFNCQGHGRRLQVFKDSSHGRPFAGRSEDFEGPDRMADETRDLVPAFNPSAPSVRLDASPTRAPHSFAGRSMPIDQGKRHRSTGASMRGDVNAIVAAPRNVVWFRGTDLRTHDHAALRAAVRNAKKDFAPVVPVFCFDPRFIGNLAKGRLTGSPKTGGFRLRFLHEAVVDLDASLRKIGVPLRVHIGKPEDVLAPLLSTGGTVFAQKEAASEEVAVEAAVRRIVKRRDATLKLMTPSTLYASQEVAGLFGPSYANMANTFTPFRNEVEKELEVPEPRPSPAANALEPDESLPKPKPIPTLEELAEALGASVEENDPRGCLDFKGGETAGLARLNYYVHESKKVGKYFETRNGMLGPDYSTKFAPWLAHGCLSPRTVHHEIAKFERSNGASKNTYWVTFEMLWRDFFRFFMVKHGPRIFSKNGITTRSHDGRTHRSEPEEDDDLFQRWVEGKTGMPLVDANMRELAATGFMSNRGRQNVASYLILDLGVDWRKGAEHFENLLLDYDVNSNWGNWVAAAGLTGGRINKFNIAKQSRDYDPDGKYIRHWLPELKQVPTQYVHEPFKMPRSLREELIVEHYPDPPPRRKFDDQKFERKHDNGRSGRFKKGGGSRRINKRGNKGYNNR